MPHWAASVLAMLASVVSRSVVPISSAPMKAARRLNSAPPAQKRSHRGEDRAEHRGEAVFGNVALAGAGPCRDGRRLEPVNGHRFLVPQLVMIADHDIVAAFHHFGRRFGEAAFIAIERRQGEQARQGEQEHQPPRTAYAQRLSINRSNEAITLGKTLGEPLGELARRPGRFEGSTAGMAGPYRLFLRASPGFVLLRSGNLSAG
jgi:hypothetical protein